MLGLHTASRRYGVKRSVLLRILRTGAVPFERRLDRAGRHRYRVDEAALEAFLRRRGLGYFGRAAPEVFPITGEALGPVTVRQASALTGFSGSRIQRALERGELPGERNESGRWLVDPRALRAWWQRRRRSWELWTGRRAVERAHLIWAFPPTPTQAALVLEVLRAGRQAVSYARERGLALEPMWTGKLVHAIHERQKPLHKTLVRQRRTRSVRK